MNGKYIMASGKQETYVGRKPEEFDINNNDHFIIGIDFNSEGILAVLCDLKGRAVKKYSAGYQERSHDHALSALFSLAETAIAENHDKNIYYIALAMQGDVDMQNGISICIDAIDGWRNVPICYILKNKFGMKTILLHDPDCLLYTESCFGYLNQSYAENATLLRIDHGIGIAAKLGGKMYMGVKGKTCEIGSTVAPSPNTDWLPLKKIVSEKAVENKFLRISGQEIPCDHIATLARQGHADAKAIFRALGRALGFALNNTINLLNPEVVVLFGEFVKFAPLFLTETTAVLTNLLGEDMPKIILSHLDTDAAAVGAALFAAKSVIENLAFTDS